MKKTSKAAVSPVVGFGVLIVLMLALAVILFKTATGEIAFASILGKKVVTIALMVSMAVVAIIMTNIWKRWHGAIPDAKAEVSASADTETIPEAEETTTATAELAVDFGKLDPKNRKGIREAEEFLEDSLIVFGEKRKELREDCKKLEEAKTKRAEMLAEGIKAVE